MDHLIDPYVDEKEMALLREWKSSYLKSSETPSSKKEKKKRVQRPLAGSECDFLSDATLRRYLIARGNASKAIKSLSDTLAWRQQNKERIDFAFENPVSGPKAGGGDCEVCANSTHQHCFLPIGWATIPHINHHKSTTTTINIPVIYGSVPRASNYEPQAAVAHFVTILEKVLRLGSPHHCNSRYIQSTTGTNTTLTTASNVNYNRFIWIFDMKGFGFKHAALVRCAVGYATTFINHYPETLCKVVILNSSTAWDLMLAAVKPILDVRTQDKIVTLRYCDTKTPPPAPRLNSHATSSNTSSSGVADTTRRRDEEDDDIDNIDDDNIEDHQGRSKDQHPRGYTFGAGAEAKAKLSTSTTTTNTSAMPGLTATTKIVPALDTELEHPLYVALQNLHLGLSNQVMKFLVEVSSTDPIPGTLPPFTLQDT